MSVKITDKPTATSMSTADKIFANIGGALKQITKEMFLKDTHDKIDQVNSNLKNLSQNIQMKGAEWTGTLESLGNNVYVCINGGNATDKPSDASLYGYYMSIYLNGGAKYCEYLDFANKKMYSKMWIGSVNNGTGWIELTK